MVFTEKDRATYEYVAFLLRLGCIITKYSGGSFPSTFRTQRRAKNDQEKAAVLIAFVTACFEVDLALRAFLSPSRISVYTEATQACPKVIYIYFSSCLSLSFFEGYVGPGNRLLKLVPDAGTMPCQTPAGPQPGWQSIRPRVDERDNNNFIKPPRAQRHGIDIKYHVSTLRHMLLT